MSINLHCPICGHQWQVVVSPDDPVLIEDDLCPHCEAQGEPDVDDHGDEDTSAS